MSAQRPHLSVDNVRATTIGTGTTETQLNDAASLIVPEKLRQFVEIIPYQSSNGAFTAGQSYLTQLRIQSNDVQGLEPKRLILDVVNGVLGATGVTLAPVLRAFPISSPLVGGERINYWGTAQVANTVAPIVGAGIVYSTEGTSSPQHFYEKPDNETAAGTTADTRTAGNTITITGCSEINALHTAIAVGTITVSESQLGFMEFTSTSWDTSHPYSVPIQPVSALLGATGGMLNGGNKVWKFPRGLGIPTPRTQLTINTFYTNDVVNTSAPNFIGGVQFYK